MAGGSSSAPLVSEHFQVHQTQRAKLTEEGTEHRERDRARAVWSPPSHSESALFIFQKQTLPRVTAGLNKGMFVKQLGPVTVTNVQ